MAQTPVQGVLFMQEPCGGRPQQESPLPYTGLGQIDRGLVEKCQEGH
jgi:hypothetical protein